MIRHEANSVGGTHPSYYEISQLLKASEDTDLTAGNATTIFLSRPSFQIYSKYLLLYPKIHVALAPCLKKIISATTENAENKCGVKCPAATSTNHPIPEAREHGGISMQKVYKEHRMTVLR